MKEETRQFYQISGGRENLGEKETRKNQIFENNNWMSEENWAICLFFRHSASDSLLIGQIKERVLVSRQVSHITSFGESLCNLLCSLDLTQLHQTVSRMSKRLKI